MTPCIIALFATILTNALCFTGAMFYIARRLRRGGL
jgi:hypothetical protein